MHKMKSLKLLCIACFWALLFSTGRINAETQKSPSDQAPTKIFYILSNGFHTGVALRTRDAGEVLKDFAMLFPRSDYLVFGWGESEFYRAKKVTSCILLKTIFLVNPAALQVIGVRGRIERIYRHSEILAVPVSDAGLANLRKYLSRAFTRDREDRAIWLGPGFSEHSNFFAAREKYSLPINCNVWTARAIRSAGVRVSPVFALTADDVMWRAQPRGKRIQTLGRPADAF
jgi:uncharacterized protein (TIGR02117 family)